MSRVLLGVKGLSTPEAVSKVTTALKAMSCVQEANSPHPDQIEIHYDEGSATVMDLIRTVRSQGFLAGML
jgi:copper chaperone